jgi:PAS domain S-box-containing protein
MPAPRTLRVSARRKVHAVREQGRDAPKGFVLDPIITMNAGGIIQSASDSVEHVFGWTPTELFGKNVKVLIPEPRRSALDRYLDRYRHADRAKSLHRTRRFDAIRKDGTPIQIELSVSRADLPMSAGPYFVGIVRDVSSQIDVGADTPESRTQLQQLITEQTRALATANLRLHLADRMAALGTLAAGLGHDMNNVLLPVRARLNALEHSGINAGAKVHLAAVRGSITYLQHLSDGLHYLVLDPDSAGANSDGDGHTNLARWWAQVGALLRKALPKHVALRAAFAARLPTISIPPHWLTQAMLNLIVNAGEAMREGQRHPRVRIWAELSDDRQSVRLAVTDNGRGMSQNVQRRAFHLFFTTKSRTMGTGLGLPLARKVALRAGGEIQLTSELGKGTTVMLVLPVSSARARASTLKARVGVVSVRHPRTAAIVSQMLLNAGFVVRSSGARAPGSADLWVTEPSRAALASATPWKRRRASRVVILLGAPSRGSRSAWIALGTSVIEPPDDFEAVRHAIE